MIRERPRDKNWFDPWRDPDCEKLMSTLGPRWVVRLFLRGIRRRSERGQWWVVHVPDHDDQAQEAQK